MQIHIITVGTAAVQLPLSSPPNFVNGLRLLARVANSGNVYIGVDPALTTTSKSNLLPQGAPATSVPYTIPVEYLASGGKVYLIADGAGQLVDWSAD